MTFDSRDRHRYPRCIMASCCVPWTDAYQLDESLFRRVVGHLATHGTRHLYIFGTAGDGHSVSERQFRQVTKVFVDECRQTNVEPMVGVIHNSLMQILERIEWAEGLGVRRFQVSLPGWATCTESETFTFFEHVCGRHSRSQFLHYNVRRAGRLLVASEYGRLSSAFSNLVAVKMAGARGSDALVVDRAAPELRLFLTEGAFAEACSLGVDAGFLISLASINWTLAKRYFDAVTSSNTGVLDGLRRELKDVGAMMREAVGDRAHIDGAYDTMFAKHQIPEFPLRVLPPYAAAEDAAFERFIQSVRDKYPHWLEHVAAGTVAP